jgi:hypothetical protein
MALSALSFIPECPFPVNTAIKTVAEVINTIQADLVVEHADVSPSTGGTSAEDEEKTRRKKLLALAYLQVFFFRHLAFTFDEHVTTAMIELVSKLLCDRSVEVRQMSAMTLSGLVRCSTDERVVERLLHGFRQAAETKPSSPEALVVRHSGVLGMSALVTAHPYDIPLWLPDTLVAIGRHASDPAPIHTTVKTTFAEFRRTHQDSWYEDVLRASGASSHQAAYDDLYDFTPEDKAAARAKRQKVASKKGVFTAEHLERLEGLLTSSVNYYV